MITKGVGCERVTGWLLRTPRSREMAKEYLILALTTTG